MTENHPITPPRKLVRQWLIDKPKSEYITTFLATQAARWGADTELEACVEWLAQNCGRWELSSALRADRRPKPPSLAEEALDALNEIEDKMLGPTIQENLIRAALERLKELEKGDE